jgi:hypothetical protein
MLLYPWQLITRAAGLHLTGRLPFAPDPARLRSDLEAVQAHYAARPHHSSWYHDGGWKAIGLITPGGAVDQIGLVEGGRYEKTEAMAHCPYFESVVDGFGLETRRVRLLSMVPGSRIYWHHDPGNALDGRGADPVVRVHVPIVTAPEIRFQIGHESCAWRPGEVWFGDFSFPHRVHNRSQTTRVHLVLDLVADAAFRRLLPAWCEAQREARMRARRRAVALCDVWHLYRDYRPPALRRWKRRLLGSAFSRTGRIAD